VLLCLLVMACAACNPLAAEFRRAVRAGVPSAADLPDSMEDAEAVARFIRTHGREALPLYERVIARNKHAKDGSFGVAELRAAIEALGEVEGVAAVPRLRALVTDARVASVARDQALRTLERISPREAIETAGQELLRATHELERVRLIGALLRMGDPAALPYLQRAREQEEDTGRREWLGVVIRVVQEPGVCHLLGKLMQGDPRGKWSCSYQCAGAQSGYLVLLPEECPDTAPRPDPRD